MKLLKITGVVCMLLIISSTTTFAAGSSPSPDADLRDRVIKLLSSNHYSSLKTGEELDIQLTFVLNKKNEIVVLEVENATRYIEQSVLDALNYKDAQVDNLKKNKPYLIDIKIVGKS